MCCSHCWIILQCNPRAQKKMLLQRKDPTGGNSMQHAHLRDDAELDFASKVPGRRQQAGHKNGGVPAHKHIQFDRSDASDHDRLLRVCSSVQIGIPDYSMQPGARSAKPLKPAAAGYWQLPFPDGRHCKLSVILIQSLIPELRAYVYAFCHRLSPASQASRSRLVATSDSSRPPAIAASRCSPP